MTEDQLKAFLAENQADIAQAVKEKTIAAMTESLRYNLPGFVREAVEQFFKDDVLPELKKHLQDQKGPIIAASVKASAEIGDKVAELLVKQAVESMTGYRSGEVVKALMGVR